jgi:hypothetical protein
MNQQELPRVLPPYGNGPLLLLLLLLLPGP